MKVRWSKPAVSDLDEIERFIALDDPGRALHFVMRLIDLGESLSSKETAERCTLAKWTKIKNIRELYYGNYTIIYQIKADEIVIHEVHNNAKMRRHFTVE